jgi:class 3 adenylate cyclase
MEQQIKYTTTPDGVRIAYSTMGSGPPLLFVVGFPFSHLTEELKTPSIRVFYEALAMHSTLIRLNVRGTGMSQRTGVEFSPELFLADIVAVLDALQLDTLDVIGSYAGGSAALELAASHPERVRKLVFIDTSPYNIDESAQYQAVMSMVKYDWRTFTQTVATAVYAWQSGADAAAMAEVLRACVEPETFLRVYEILVRDFTRERQLPLVRAVRAPALVLQHEKAFSPPIEVAQELTAELSDATMVMLDGAWFNTDAQALEMVKIILEFLGLAGDEEAAQTSERAASATAVILFTDIADSTALTERLGDARFREMSRALDAGLRGAIRECGGTTVEAKTLGDGVLATFGSAAQAIEGARRCLALSAASELGLHIGVHAGDVIREEGNVFGGAVNIAARICSLSEAGEILVSDVVRGMARTSAGVAFEDRGEREMKGVGEPVRVYRVVGGS